MVNRMRSTRSHTGNRRSHDALKDAAMSLCPDCKSPKLAHAVCPNCGKYNGRVVIDMVAKLAKKEAKLKEKNKELGKDPKEKDPVK